MAVRTKEKKGTRLSFIVVVISLGIVIASAALCAERIISVNTPHTLSSSSFSSDASGLLIYKSGDKVTVWEAGESNAEKHTYSVDGKITHIDEGKSCAVITTSREKYFVTASELIKMDGCVTYRLASESPVCVYLTSDGRLYKCTTGEPAEISPDVMQFAVAPHGDVYYLRDDIHPSDDRKPTDKNGFYREQKELGYDDPEDACETILCANNFGLYYSTANHNAFLLTPNADDAGNKFKVEDFEKLISVGNNSILITKSDGSTYIWKADNEETLLCESALNKMVLPQGHVFFGDEYTALFYETNGGIVRVNGDGALTERIEGAKKALYSGDCTKLFYTDEESKLYCFDTRYGKKRECGENVSDFAVTSDGRKAWFISGDRLMLFDGYSARECAECSGIRELFIAEYDIPIIVTEARSGQKNKNGTLYSYTDELKEINGSESSEFIGETVFGFCFVNKEGVHVLCSDGVFRAYDDIHKKAEDSDTTGGEGE